MLGTSIQALFIFFRMQGLQGKGTTTVKLISLLIPHTHTHTVGGILFPIKLCSSWVSPANIVVLIIVSCSTGLRDVQWSNFVTLVMLLWCKELSNCIDVHEDILVETIKIRLKSVKLFLFFVKLQ